MKQLTPLFLREAYWVDIQREIDRVLWHLVYLPLQAIMSRAHPELYNAKESSLLARMREGLIWYEDGKFDGAFNAQTTRELRALGAIYRPSIKKWTLAPQDVPAELKIAQVSADSRYEALRRSLMTGLADIDVAQLDAMKGPEEAYKRALGGMDEDFKKSVASVSIPPKLTDHQRDRIAQEWGQNLNKYIKSWTEKNILELREKLQAETFMGRRAASLEGLIQQNYGVSQRKAKFLARQETSLLMAKFRETRYAEVGVRRYRWSTSHDERVRKDHKHLNGKIFFFDQPPITNTDTGARNNPGEDFGCRCVAIALVD